MISADYQYRFYCRLVVAKSAQNDYVPILHTEPGVIRDTLKEELRDQTKRPGQETSARPGQRT